MAVKNTREQLRQKKINTRDVRGYVDELLDRHGWHDPLYLCLAWANGYDPRIGPDVYIDQDNIGGTVTGEMSLKAAAEAMKILYVPASKLEIAGEINATLPQVSPEELSRATREVAEMLIRDGFTKTK